MKNPEVVEVQPGLQVRVANLPAFLATKFDAFSDRGDGSYLGDSDIEDIISLLRHRDDCTECVEQASIELQEYLSNEAVMLLRTPDLEFIIAT